MKGPLLLIERLGVASLLLRALPHALGAATARFIDAGPAARLLARAAAELGLDIAPLDFRWLEVRDEAGRTYGIGVYDGDLRALLPNAAETLDLPGWLDSVPDAERLETFLFKSVSPPVQWGRANLPRALFLLRLAEWTARRMGGGTARLHLESRGFRDPALRSTAQRRGLALSFAPRHADWKGLLAGLLGPDLLTLLRHARARGLAGARAVLRRWREAEPPPVQIPARLAVDYYGQLNLDDPALQSDLFFWRPSGLGAERLLLLFRTIADPLDGRRLEELSRHGIEALAIDPAAASPEAPLFLPGRARAHAPPGAGDAGRWLRAQTLRYRALRGFWEELCRRSGARVYLSWYRHDETHAAIADAFAAAGGVAAFYQRSFEPPIPPHAAVDADLYFAWSPAGAQAHARGNSRLRRHIAVGFLGDHRFPLLRERASALREELARAGARFVLAFFDENSLDDARWYPGHGPMREDYGFLLERLLADPELGLVLKPKVPRSLAARLGPTAELLRRAQATGRCRILGGGLLHGSHCPAEAALAADLAVHSQFRAATASVEAALAGVPTVMLDRENCVDGPLARLGVGRSIFRGLSELWEPLAERRRGGARELGDWSCVLPALDPYRDGRAAERMGVFLGWVLEALDAGKGRDAAIDAAASRFAERWGADKVAEVPRDSWR